MRREGQRRGRGLGRARRFTSLRARDEQRAEGHDRQPPDHAARTPQRFAPKRVASSVDKMTFWSPMLGSDGVLRIAVKLKG
jgi:hypothetical protein